MLKRNIYLDFSYLLVIAASFGAVIVLGAIVAPVIFHSDRYLVGMLIDHYNMGMIMGEIFRRFAYWSYFLAGYIAFYEAYMYKSGQRDAIVFGAAVTAIFSALMFAAVYVPKILSMQSMGKEATQSDTFANIHIASEIDFKLLAVALLVLFVRRLMLLRID
ncbi:membrane protein [hydrothermal vent metagenome]|uniref:Membrane protein n=1 Tax=hydrothermal vent metagenome TaxID=652676 RepID=A0A1W1CMT4_9ZZZZ